MPVPECELPDSRLFEETAFAPSAFSICAVALNTMILPKIAASGLAGQPRDFRQNKSKMFQTRWRIPLASG
jgi:hypothetical protein